MKTEKIKVSKYRRNVKGKVIKVPEYKRRQRKKGRTYHWQKVGQMSLKFDNYGNIRGSKVSKLRQRADTRRIDTDYYLGKISYPEWQEQRKQINR